MYVNSQELFYLPYQLVQDGCFMATFQMPIPIVECVLLGTTTYEAMPLDSPLKCRGTMARTHNMHITHNLLFTEQVAK